MCTFIKLPAPKFGGMMASAVSELNLLYRNLNAVRETFDWQGGEFFLMDLTTEKATQVFAKSLDLIQKVNRQMDAILATESVEGPLNSTQLAITSNWANFASKVRSLYDELRAGHNIPIKEYEQRFLRLGDSIRAVFLLLHAHLVLTNPDKAADTIWNDLELPFLPVESDEEAEEAVVEEPKHKSHRKREAEAPFEAFVVTNARDAAAYRVQLARAIDLGRLAKVCPAGFGALANEIQTRWFSG